MIGIAIFAVVILCVGVLVNAAVIWIYTSKNSRVNKSGQREFPLMFAAIDLIAVTIKLPLHTTVIYYLKSGVYPSTFLREPLHFAFGFVLYGYLFCLLTATVDKFYAVYFPFKYRLVHKRIIKIAIGLVFGFNIAINGLMRFVNLVLLDFRQHREIHRAVHDVIYGLFFVSVSILFVLIVVKLVQSGKKFNKVELKPAAK